MIWFLFIFFFRFMFTPVKHLFASLIDKQLSRKATVMLQDVLLFDVFQQTYLIFFYFHLNVLRNVPAKTYRSGKKRIAFSQRPGGQIRFSPEHSACNRSACSMTWKQAQPYNKMGYHTLLDGYITDIGKKIDMCGWNNCYNQRHAPTLIPAAAPGPLGSTVWT